MFEVSLHVKDRGVCSQRRRQACTGIPQRPCLRQQFWSASWSCFGLSRDCVQEDELQEGRHVGKKTVDHEVEIGPGYDVFALPGLEV